MSKTDIIKIAFLNIKAGNRSFRKIVFGLSFAVMLSAIIFSVIVSFNAYTDNFDRENSKECFFYKKYDSRLSNESLSEIKKITMEFVDRYSGDDMLTLLDINPTDNESLTTYDSTDIVVGQDTYKLGGITTSFRNPYEDINYSKKNITYGLYRSEYNIYRDEYRGNAIIAGNYPINEGEIIMDDYVLKLYGIKNPEQLIGQKISIVYNDGDKHKAIFEDYILSGILDVKAIDSRETYRDMEPHLEHIYVNPKAEDYSDYMVQGDIRCYFDSYSRYINEYDDIEDILRIHLSDLCEDNENNVLLSVCGIEFCLLHWMMTHAGYLMLIIFLVIIFIIVMSLLYILGFYRDRNVRYYSMLFSIGMEKTDRRKIYSVELMAMFLAAVVIGVYMAIVLLLLLGAVTSMSLDFGFVYSVKAFLAGIISVLALFSVCSYIQLRNM